MTNGRMLSLAVTLAAFLALILAALPAWSDQTPVDAEALKAMVAGKTYEAEIAVGKHKGKTFVMFFKADGGLANRSASGKSDQGKWWVDDDGRLCRVYTTKEENAHGRQRCYAVFSDGKGAIEFRYKKRTVSKGAFIDGKPQGL